MPAQIAGSFLIAALAAAPASAAIYKCPDGNGNIVFQGVPCGTVEPAAPLLGQSADPRPAEGIPDGPGLWEITTRFRPRLPPRGEAARARMRTGDESTDDPAAIAPVRQLSCADKSPLKAWLSPSVAGRCRTQIAARDGKCVVQDDKGDGQGSEIKEVLMLDGNYRTELHVISRLSTASPTAPEPVTDEARIDLRLIGECKPGMSPGDTFQAGPNGNWVKVR